MRASEYRDMTTEQLGEELQGVMIDSTTSVRDFVAEHDQINTDMQTYLMGARVVSTEYDAEGTATVTVEAPLQRWWEIVSVYIQVRR